MITINKPPFIGAALLSFIIILALSLAVSCVEIPSEPENNNPLDPDNPETGGDPYRLTAVIADGGVRLNWSSLSIPDLIGYTVYRSVDEGEYTSLVQMEMTTTTCTDRTIVNGHRYSYYIVARSEGGEAGTTEEAAVTIDADPMLVIEGEDVTETPTRNVTLTLLAFGAEKMLIANDPSFTDVSWEPFASSKSWQLATGTGTKTVHTQVIWDNGDTSDVVSDVIEPAPLDASVLINSGNTETPTREVTLALSATGAVEMIVSNESVPDGELIKMDARKRMIETDQDRSMSVPQDPKRNNDPTAKPASSRIPHKQDKATPQSKAVPGLDHSGNPARETTAEWQPYTETLDWTLSTGAGTKTVHVTLRNDFLIEETVSDDIEPTPLNTSLTIAGGAETTPTRTVNLELSATGAIEMQLANDTIPDTTSWQSFATSISDWMLETGVGTKTVTLNVRNDFLIEETVSDAIEPAILRPALTILPADSEYINHWQVALSMPGVGAAIMKLANTPDSNGVGWIDYQESYSWDLGSDGEKIVYAWFVNDWYPPSVTVSDTIKLDTQAEVASFSWTSSSENDTLSTGDYATFTLTLSDDAFGPETGGVAQVTVEDWQTFMMADEGNGTYSATTDALRWDRTGISNAAVSVSFTDRAGNGAGATSPDALNVADDVLWRTLTGHSDVVYSVAFSPDGTTLASGSGDHTIKLWRVNDGSL
ncbi:MAG: hypothetical protein V2A56_03600, partial [bacterium]